MACNHRPVWADYRERSISLFLHAECCDYTNYSELWGGEEALCATESCFQPHSSSDERGCCGFPCSVNENTLFPAVGVKEWSSIQSSTRAPASCACRQCEMCGWGTLCKPIGSLMMLHTYYAAECDHTHRWFHLSDQLTNNGCPGWALHCCLTGLWWLSDTSDFIWRTGFLWGGGGGGML